ncbi:UDP-N-acetyl glucosamine 2-epimerase [Methylococcaceae bacterium WWC4]|nr:UDP-N-acetyl glucosamine 2-epimerase [Methylococcaceae bacterium WWC4]
MIYVVLGTRAQLVKMAPVVRHIEDLNWPLTLLYTGQHRESMDDLSRDFQFGSKWFPLYRSIDEVKTVSHALIWLTKLGLAIALYPERLLPANSRRSDSIILVHGDTLSTLLGALLGKRLNIKVGHVEAGLRSFRLFNPFPEEIIRRITAYLSDIAFCPGEWALNNLKNHKRLVKIDTGCNTIVDALNLAISRISESQNTVIPDCEYGVISIHRFENIFFAKKLRNIVDQLLYVADQYRLVFVLHPATRKRLIASGLMIELEQHPNIDLKDRTGYVAFVQLLASAKFVITDGGSNQEELSILNVPTLLMRKATERQEGLGVNIHLSKFSFDALNRFLDDLRYRSIDRPRQLGLDRPSPSAVICQAIEFAALP